MSFWRYCCSAVSCVQLFVIPWTAAYQPSLSFTISRSLLKFTSVESVVLSNHLISAATPFSSCPQSFPASVFSNESALLIRWPKYWNFSFCPSNEYSGLVSFRIEWFDLLAVQRMLKNLLQHHSSKGSVLQHSVLSIVQLSHPYIITGKTIALTIWTLVRKVMSLLFNTLSRLVIAFLPRSQVSFNFMAALTICSDFGAPQNKVSHCFHCFPIYLP